MKISSQNLSASKEIWLQRLFETKRIDPAEDGLTNLAKCWSHTTNKS